MVIGRAVFLALMLLILCHATPALSQSLGDTDPVPALALARAEIAMQLGALPADPFEATAARHDGDRAMSDRRWSEAQFHYERAIAIDGGDVRSWLRLAEARRRAGATVGALNAATAARALATSASDRAIAWAVIARSLDRLGERRAALEAFEASLEARADPMVQRGYETLQARLRFAVQGRELHTEGEEAELCLQFSATLRDREALIYGDYIGIEPAIAPIFNVTDKTLCIAGFSYGQSYDVTVRAGMPGADDRTLGEDSAIEIAVPDREPLIGFRSSAYVLPRVGSTGVPLTTVNVDEAKLTLLRINDRNLVSQIRDGYMMRLFSSYDRDWVVSDLGEEIWTGSIAIQSVLNEQVVTAVPVQEMIPEIEPGVYVLMAETANGAIEYWETRATQWLIVSDIGLTTYDGADGLTVVVRSLDSALPMAGVTLTLYARNNEALGTVTTSDDGIARFAPGLMRGELGLMPLVLMASHDSGDFSYLDISTPAFDLSDRGVGGRAIAGPQDAFLYTDRGVYRPGETVQLMALLRDGRGEALTGLPLFIDVVRPDGSIARTVKAIESGLGGYHVPIEFTTATPTGRWDIHAYVDPEAAPVGSAGFLIEDIVPAQIEVAISTDAVALTADRPAAVAVDARYLYGAPGAGLAVQAELVIDRDPDPFPEFPGFHFGLADETVEPTRTSFEGPATDAEGRAELTVGAVAWPDTANPLRATLYVDVLEPGGRAVGEILALPIHDESAVIGIKPRFEDDEAPQGMAAEFVIALIDARSRAILPIEGLRYQLIEEQWDYSWYYRYAAWDYEVTTHDVPVVSGALDATGSLSLAVDWGHYRLEVFDPDAGIAASYRFSSGWFGRPGDGDTPDALQVTFDRETYRPGDSAHAYITAPFEGPVQLVLASDRIFRTWTVEAGPEGAIAEFVVDAEWGAGAYLLATAFRAGDGPDRHGPGRAVGVSWLEIDPSLRTLEIAIDVPERVEPRQRIEVPISLNGFAPEGPVFMTLAAVDEGILQLTDFADPDPADYYFNQRSLGVEIRDLYGRLLDGLAGTRGEIRAGGDAGAGRRGAPGQIELVALFSGIVSLDATGRTTIALDLPDYNGRLRLMAVAWDSKRVGSASVPLIVRDPVTTVISAPRFLAPGDHSQLTVTMQNLDGPPGEYRLTVVGNESVGAADTTVQAFALKAGASATASIAIDGLTVGDGRLVLSLAGPAGWQVERAVAIGVRPAQLPTLDRVAYRLEPGESLTVGADIAGRFVPGSGEALVTFGGRPNLDVAGLLRSLDRYPYGCLEQTTSRALPLLYVAEVAKLWGQAEDEAELRARVDGAIGRILDMQRWDGSFGIWSSYGYTDNWLTAFAMDFLTRARLFGYDVPDFAYQNGIDWLMQRVGVYDARMGSDLADRSYAAYVLASAGFGDAAPLRYMYDTLERDSGGQPMSVSPLTMAHLGAGLALFGEIDRAQTAFAEAISIERYKYERYYDYGSPVRDLALTVALASEAGIANFDTVAAVERLIALYATRPYLSTQEEGALLLAAARIGGDGDFTLAMNDANPVQYDNPLRIYRAGAELVTNVTYRNAGDSPVWANVTLIGSPTEILPPAADGITIERHFFDLAGNPIDPAQMRQGDIVLIQLDVDIADEIAGQVLVVDLLPAGLEAENPHLADSRNAEAFAWLPELAVVDHEEYRDDRYVAAVTREQQGRFSLAYLVRAVTPGGYVYPAPVAEAMYDPSVRGRGEAGRIVVSAAR